MFVSARALHPIARLASTPRVDTSVVAMSTSRGQTARSGRADHHGQFQGAAIVSTFRTHRLAARSSYCYILPDHPSSSCRTPGTSHQNIGYPPYKVRWHLCAFACVVLIRMRKYISSNTGRVAADYIRARLAGRSSVTHHVQHTTPISTSPAPCPVADWARGTGLSHGQRRYASCVEDCSAVVSSRPPYEPQQSVLESEACTFSYHPCDCWI